MGVSLDVSACGRAPDFLAAGVPDPSASSGDKPPTMGYYSKSGLDSAIGPPDDFLFGDVELPFDDPRLL